jgi:hypothetical protein
MEQWPLSLQLYESMREGCRKKQNMKYVNQTTSLLLLPLEKSREKVEDVIDRFAELVQF